MAENNQINLFDEGCVSGTFEMVGTPENMVEHVDGLEIMTRCLSFYLSHDIARM